MGEAAEGKSKGFLAKLKRLLHLDDDDDAASAAARNGGSPKKPQRSKRSGAVSDANGGAVQVPVLDWALVKLEDQLRINWSDLEVGQQIGRGGFGIVYKGKWHANRVAIKLLYPDRVDAELLANLREEALMMGELRHPSIARVYGLVVEKGRVAIVMHYYRHGTVEELMNGVGQQPAALLAQGNKGQSNGSTASDASTSTHASDPYAPAGPNRMYPSFNAAASAAHSGRPGMAQFDVQRYEDLHMVTRLRMALQVAKGMMFLHTRSPTPIVHGDLKASNLLMDGHCRVVLADFGLARPINRQNGTTKSKSKLAELLHMGGGGDGNSSASLVRSAMTAHIVPPEVIANPSAQRQPPVDVFAFGVVLMEMVLGRNAYDDKYPPKLILRDVLAGKRPEVPSDPVAMPPDVAKLIKECWAQDAAARPNFTQVVARLEQVVEQLLSAYSDYADADSTRWL